MLGGAVLDGAGVTEGAPTLTYALRGLVWGLESDIAVVSSLSRQIDARVRALNAARAEVAERLLHLDELVASADQPDLQAFLRARAVAPLPVEDEVFPERLYG